MEDQPRILGVFVLHLAHRCQATLGPRQPGQTIVPTPARTRAFCHVARKMSVMTTSRSLVIFRVTRLKANDALCQFDLPNPKTEEL